LSAIHRFFAMARERGATRLDIPPWDLRAQRWGGMAVVSFLRPQRV
jgi:hypothetical protein